MASLPKPPVRRDETAPSMQDAAKAAGLPATPSSPLGASGLPLVSPDVAKMAGVPAAAPAALGGIGAAPTPPAAPAAPAANPSQPPASLSDALRQKAAPAKAPVQTQEDIDRQTRVQEAKEAYGYFGAAAQRLIDSYAANPPAPAPAPTASSAGLSAIGVTETPSVDAAITAWAQNPTPQTYTDLLKATGKTPEQLSADDARALVNLPDAAAAAAAATPEKAALSDDTLSRMGVTREQAAKLFSPGTDLSKLSVADLTKAAQAHVAGAQGELSALQHTLADPLAGAEARDAAAQELLARGGIVRATEGDAERLAADAEKGFTVDVGGKKYSVEDLLDDTQMSALIHNYLAEPADSPLRAEMAKKMPGLVAFIDKHTTALSEAASHLAASVTETKEKSAVAKQAYTKLTSGPMAISDDDIAALLGKDVLSSMKDPYSLHAVDLSKAGGLVQMLLDPTKVADPKGLLDRIHSVPPDMLADLGKLSAEDLHKIDFDAGGPKWQAFVAARQAHDAFEDTSRSPEDRLKAYLGQDFSLAGAGDMLASAEASAKVSGDDTALSALQDILDKDRNGKIDSPADILDRMEGSVGKYAPSLKQLLKGSVPAGPALPQDVAKASEGQKLLSSWADAPTMAAERKTLGNALLQPADGPARNLTWNDLGGAADDQSKGIWPHLSTEGKQELTQLLDDNAALRATAEIGKLRTPTGDLLRIPWSALDPAAQKVNGQAVVAPEEEGARIPDADGMAAAGALASMQTMQLPYADDKDHPSRVWAETIDRLTRLVGAFFVKQHAAGRDPIAEIAALPGGKGPDMAKALDVLLKTNPATAPVYLATRGTQRLEKSIAEKLHIPGYTPVNDTVGTVEDTVGKLGAAGTKTKAGTLKDALTEAGISAGKVLG